MACPKPEVAAGGKRGILNCSRQWGKSTVAAAKAVHRAYWESGSQTLLLTRQSGEFIRKAKEFVRRLGIPVKGDGDNKASIAFRTGRASSGCRRARRKDRRGLAGDRRDELDNAPERNRNGMFGRSTCEFVEREGAAFSQESIDAAFQDFEPMKI